MNTEAVFQAARPFAPGRLGSLGYTYDNGMNE